ncbi:PorT family protein [Chitinophagaceae bacterium LB-8]|uniref:PorT family protein n=1 Tax=Paraflavisolibacter caeni TaxID=2982496 RepID=A0A9X2XS14_9BACT|nr:porin family protein [Paraflavisolibacter caeni]MCU7547894.1 PorT family protein [Paraflavisolibacter caeni]
MYKKIVTMLCVSALMCVNQLQAQLYVGVEAGANRNYLVTNASDKPFLDYQPLYGYSAGVSVRYAFPSRSWFGGIQAVPTYIQKNFKMQRTDYYSPMYQQSTNTFLELPVMAQFRFGGKFTKHQSLYGILNLGGYAEYWMSGHVKGRAMSSMDPNNYLPYDEAYTFSEVRDRRFQLGGLAGVGLQYMPNKKYTFSIEGRYTPALTDLQKAYSENQTPKYNDNYSILVGVQYQLPKLKVKNHSSAK